MPRLLSTTALGVCLSSTAVFAAPNVATDIAPVHGLVARVMDGVGEPSQVVPSNASPHGYALRPSEARALSNADVIFWVGEEFMPQLEGAIDTLGEDAQSIALLDGAGVLQLPYRTEFGLTKDDDHGDEHADDDHGDDHGDEHAEDDHDHDHGDEHAEDDHDDRGGTDPHAWLHPDNAKAWLTIIADTLADVDPDNAATYRANAEAGIAEITAVEAQISADLAPLAGVPFVVFHDAYQYFESAFGLNAAGSISLGDASAPSAARIAALQEEIEHEGITCAFREPQYNDRLIATVFEGVDVTVGVIDPVGADIAPGPDFYPALLTSMAAAFDACR